MRMEAIARVDVIDGKLVVIVKAVFMAQMVMQKGRRWRQVE